MSTTQWILNLGLLGWVLLRNLGTTPVTRSTFLLPVLIVAVAGAAFLTDIPTAGNDIPLDLIAITTGVLLGVAATRLTQIRPTPSGLTITAGAAFAALWFIVIGGRIAFAQWATGPGSRAIGEFSEQHQITGADAWTAGFVLMALGMVLARVVSTAIAVHRSKSVTTVPAVTAVR